MMGTSRVLALGLVLAFSLVVTACAPAEGEDGDVAGARAGATPAPAGEAPARDTPWAATPGVGGIPGNPEGVPGSPRPTPGVGEPTGTRQVTGVDLLIDDIVAFNGRLDGLTGGTILPFAGQRPLPSDLTGMTQQATTLLRGIEQQFQHMSDQDRQEALREMRDAVGTMARVVEYYEEETRADLDPMRGTSPAPAAIPATTGTDGARVGQEIEQIRTEIDGLAGAEPSGQQVAGLLTRMERALDGMSERPGQVEAAELGALAEALEELLGVMEEFAQADYAAGSPGGETPAGGPAPGPTPRP
jgi:hypothetical protein